ncbi:dynein-related subfamily AAA family protein [Alkalibaculum bacchi]|uniref:Dynein-related subfamily AAA family protein n=1 Tax=Alkalibaculum bacchi TaxID=645887 RepID=A0A366I2N1_9FIRM|nr:AAA family ATPase [Alkalibaculum bacchi]RBP61860.1 dynein-related subfamily AAA family protein [Alkalibaculum bacchi]
MAISKNISKDDILKAIKYIDENDVPDKNKSTKYELIDKSGKRYPPKYVIAVANHLVNHEAISTEGFNAVEAKNFLEGLNFLIETKQEKFELIITANEVTSTDDQFTLDNIGLGDNYKPLDTYFKNASGAVVRRKYNKGERRNSNQTMPRLACQVFEQLIAALPAEEKENFPICQYTPSTEVIRGIFSSVEEFKKHRNTIEYLIYSYDAEKQFVIYCWNIFSTILFVRDSLKRFGHEGDQFVLVYREKETKEAEQPENEEVEIEEQVKAISGYRNPYSSSLIESKNIILRGAPGTGKTYLAKEIAADIISNGYFDTFSLLTDEQKKQVEFVQFHPNYDYSDFVEGLRPKTYDDGSVGFELQEGVFKKFVAKAKKNFDDSQKPQEVIEKEASIQEIMSDYFSSIELGVDELEIARGTKFYITGIDDKYIHISAPENKISNKLKLNISELKGMLESGQNFTQVKDVTLFFRRVTGLQKDSYYLATFNAIKANKSPAPKSVAKPDKLKPYIFIIDEINRGEISKIFGELFFSIDPGYRGQVGEVSTQYANMHDNPDEKFYIPENVYIIGTMNDIDRSVDSFDFAMRRRFRFIEIKSDERLEMLDTLGEDKEEAIRRMTALNNEISNVEELNENYHIGASYFLKLKYLTFDQLWADYLQPLLQEYVRGMYDENGIMEKFAKGYGYTGDRNDRTQD